MLIHRDILIFLKADNWYWLNAPPHISHQPSSEWWANHDLRGLLGTWGAGAKYCLISLGTALKVHCPSGSKSDEWFVMKHSFCLEKRPLLTSLLILLSSHFIPHVLPFFPLFLSVIFLFFVALLPLLSFFNTPYLFPLFRLSFHSSIFFIIFLPCHIPFFPHHSIYSLCLITPSLVYPPSPYRLLHHSSPWSSILLSSFLFLFSCFLLPSFYVAALLAFINLLSSPLPFFLGLHPPFYIFAIL